MKYGTLSQQMAKNGVKLRTWAKAKGLSKKDIALLNQISHRLIKGKRCRAKQLKEMLEKDGFELV